MAKITIDGKEYDTDNLSAEAQRFLNSILFVDTQIQRLQNEMRVYMAARALYLQELKKHLPED